MKTMRERCEEAIRKEILKEIEGKLCSTNVYGHFVLKETNGKYRVVDVEVSLYEESVYDNDGYCGERRTFEIFIICETLKLKKVRKFSYDIFEGEIL